MTRILIQLINRIMFICTGIIAITLLVGYSLPTEAELLFTASYNLSDLNIYR